MKKILLNLFIACSLIVGSVYTFWIYTMKYLDVNVNIADKITDLLKEIGVLEVKYDTFMLVLCCICVFLFWILGFIMYKIIFEVSHVKVKDVQLLIALGSAYMISFLLGYFLVGSINLIVLSIIINVVEIATIYMSLFDEIKTGLKKCVIIRAVIVLLNVWLTSIGV